MIRVSCCVLLVLGLVLPVAGQRRSEKTKALKPVELKLKPARLKKGEEFRMGFGVEGDPKTEPLLGVWKRRKIYFFDLDGNGSIEAGKDGFASLPDPFIVRLPQRWLFHDGQYRVSSGEEGTLLLEPEDPGSIAAFQDAAAHVNDLRLKAGSPMVVLDRQASEDCRKHCDYLATHGMADGSGGLAAHVEEPDKAGFRDPLPEGLEGTRGRRPILVPECARNSRVARQ